MEAEKKKEEKKERESVSYEMPNVMLTISEVCDE